MVDLRHILVIPDGNRRFAEVRGIDHNAIYNVVAVNVTIQLIELILLDKNIRELSIFMLSRNNVLKRPKENLKPIVEAQIQAYNKILANEKLMNSNIQFNFIGDKAILTKEYVEVITKLEEKTRTKKGNVCNFLTGYDGSWELLQTLKKIHDNKEEVNEFNLYKNLELQAPVDLIIRTGGEKRLSSCPLIQSSYSEIYFADFFYPEFNAEKLNGIIKYYESRERRFGK